MKNKRIMKKILDYRSNLGLNLRDELMDYMDSREEYDLMKPKSKKKYVGIEIECFCPDRVKLQQYLLELDLENYVQLGEDGSIDHPPECRDVELRCLIPEKALSRILKKLGKALKLAKCDVNDSCGLHVHLDMRHRNVDKCYKKLLKFQEVMFGLVDEDRWTNDMCKWTTAFDQTKRYQSINRTSYQEHKTIEVRLHHGTVNTKEIENWVRLLIKAISPAPAPNNVVSIKDAAKWAGRDKKLKSYITKTFNPEWFKERGDVVSYSGGGQDDDVW